MFKRKKKKFKTTIENLKKRAKELDMNLGLLYKAYRHPKTPWYAKLIVIVTLAYALSPIDLIPDFIPVIGYLDDLIIIPLGISLSIKLIPKSVIEECRLSLIDRESIRKRGRGGAVFIILTWLLIIYAILKYMLNVT